MRQATANRHRLAAVQERVCPLEGLQEGSVCPGCIQLEAKKRKHAAADGTVCWALIYLDHESRPSRSSVQRLLRVPLNRLCLPGSFQLLFLQIVVIIISSCRISNLLGRRFGFLHRPRSRRRSLRCVPQLAALELRALLSTISVTNDNDNGNGSLRAALASAANGDTIDFAPSAFGTITLSSGPLEVATSGRRNLFRELRDARSVVQRIF